MPNNFIQINITAPNAENIEMEFNDKIQKNTELIYKIKWKWHIEQMAKILTVFFQHLVQCLKELATRAFDVPKPARRDIYLLTYIITYLLTYFLTYLLTYSTEQSPY